VVEAMSGYSERSQQLALEPASKAAGNLSRSGEVVTRSATTGGYGIEDRRSGTASRPAKD
jgi:hypothetical protein